MSGPTGGITGTGTGTGTGSGVPPFISNDAFPQRAIPAGGQAPGGMGVNYNPPVQNFDPRRDLLIPVPITPTGPSNVVQSSLSKSSLVSRGITGASGLVVGSFLTVDTSFASAWGIAPGGYQIVN